MIGISKFSSLMLYYVLSEKFRMSLQAAPMGGDKLSAFLFNFRRRSLVRLFRDDVSSSRTKITHHEGDGNL